MAGVIAVGAGFAAPSAQQVETWPRFRGPRAAGIAEKQNLPDSWDGVAGKNVRWKVEVPGLAHSSPIVWGDRLFVTSAVSSDAKATFKPGLYGEGTASEDTSVQRWVVLAIDRRTGKTIWERTAREEQPHEATRPVGSPSPAAMKFSRTGFKVCKDLSRYCVTVSRTLRSA